MLYRLRQLLQRLQLPVANIEVSPAISTRLKRDIYCVYLYNPPVVSWHLSNCHFAHLSGLFYYTAMQ